MPCFLQGASFGIKAYCVTLVGFFVLKGNVFLLKFYSSEEVLGYYSIASQLNDCLAILPTSMGLVLFPNLVRNEEGRWLVMKNSIWIFSCLMLLICIVCALLANLL